MKPWKAVSLILCALAVAAAGYGLILVRRGFSALATPSAINWLSERLKRHSKTDSRIELRVVRLAADGVWLERIMNAKSKNLKGVEEYLIEMTRIR